MGRKVFVEKQTHTVEYDGAVFEGTPLDQEQETRLMEKYTEYKRVKGQLLPKTDFIGLKISKVQKTIQSWDLEDPDGNPLECTDAMKRVVYLNNSDLIDGAMEKFAEIGRGNAEIKKELEGNSEPGSSGDLTQASNTPVKSVRRRS